LPQETEKALDLKEKRAGSEIRKLFLQDPAPKEKGGLWQGGLDRRVGSSFVVEMLFVVR